MHENPDRKVAATIIFISAAGKIQCYSVLPGPAAAAFDSGWAGQVPRQTPVGQAIYTIGHVFSNPTDAMRALNWLFAAVWALAAGHAVADNAVDEKLLGLSEPALREQLPAVVKLDRPVFGPHRLRGSYALRNGLFFSQPFEAIFYFRDGRVSRIEQRQSNPPLHCAAQYSDLNASLSARYGASADTDTDTDANANANANADGGADLAQRSLGLATPQSNAWSMTGFNVLLHKIEDASRCELLVVFLPHSLIDASEL